MIPIIIINKPKSKFKIDIYNLYIYFKLTFLRFSAEYILNKLNIK